MYAKFKAHVDGERVNWNGQEKTPLYTPKAETLIAWFQITEEEQRQLKVIHSNELRRELNTEKNVSGELVKACGRLRNITRIGPEAEISIPNL